jgi:hypothetical protein
VVKKSQVSFTGRLPFGQHVAYRLSSQLVKTVGDEKWLAIKPLVYGLFGIQWGKHVAALPPDVRKGSAFADIVVL